jgi:hypothetical protein
MKPITLRRYLNQAELDGKMCCHVNCQKLPLAMCSNNYMNLKVPCHLWKAFKVYNLLIKEQSYKQFFGQSFSKVTSAYISKRFKL